MNDRFYFSSGVLEQVHLFASIHPFVYIQERERHRRKPKGLLKSFSYQTE